jgi:flagellar basal-body rod protein FlgF
LDVAVQGPGWIAVQAPDGSEAYTRAGNFQIGADGTLQLPNGMPVVGAGGPISMPADSQAVEIAPDGTISVKSASSPKASANAGQLKLVNPPAGELSKGLDGLFHLAGGTAAEADPTVRVTNGALEGSNVNVVEAMVGMISAARQYELQMRMLGTAEQNEQKAGTVLGA